MEHATRPSLATARAHVQPAMQEHFVSCSAKEASKRLVARMEHAALPTDHARALTTRSEVSTSERTAILATRTTTQDTAISAAL
jgi:hypothetical protein